MALFDVVIVSIVLVSVLIGVFRGFIKELLSISTWALSLLVAYRFSGALSDHLVELIGNDQVRRVAAFLLLFVTSFAGLGLAAYFIKRLFDAINLSSTDRALGGVFGLLRGLVVVGLIVFIINQTPYTESHLWRESVLVGYVNLGIDWLWAQQPQSFSS